MEMFVIFARKDKCTHHVFYTISELGDFILKETNNLHPKCCYAVRIL